MLILHHRSGGVMRRVGPDLMHIIVDDGHSFFGDVKLIINYEVSNE